MIVGLSPLLIVHSPDKGQGALHPNGGFFYAVVSMQMQMQVRGEAQILVAPQCAGMSRTFA